MAKPFFHADQVGSLLRPERLLKARDRFERSELTRQRLTEIEDACIREVAKHQESVGLESVCDGEFRRSIWWFEFVDAINGVEVTDPDTSLTFRGDHENEWKYAPKNVLTIGKLSRPVAAAVEARGWIVADIWPRELPAPLQAVLMLLISDFLRYWLHRAFH